MRKNYALAHRAALAKLIPFSLVGLAACGDDPAGGSAASSALDLTTVRACELLTAPEIEAATGIAAAGGQDKSQVDGQLPICNWPRAGGAEYDTLVNVLVARSGVDTYEEFMQNTRDTPLAEALGEDAFQEVGGVGDFGVWIGETKMLQVYDREMMVQVTAGATAGGDDLEAAKALAAAALRKLP
jgi:hypothetical protein